ncbi:MAG: AmmeMemoRadiSam system protein B [Calditrichia bacterium]
MSGRVLLTFLFFTLSILIWNCRSQPEQKEPVLRALADTVGFAHTATQMDSIIARIDRLYGSDREGVFQILNVPPDLCWKMIICPHDDYAYAGDLYPYVIKNLTAPVVIIFGVAHKARQFNVEDQIVFDGFSHWRGPYGPIPVSSLREDLLKKLPPEIYQVNDSLQQVEHSVEALLPFLQYYHRSVQIVSILVPYMSYERMDSIARTLAGAIHELLEEKQWNWGTDIALAISNDCVHYGDQGWGGKNYAPFGADSAGYREAVNYDLNIINECLIDEIDPQRVKRFVQYTVRKDNYKEYAWTWCGRYSVPFGVLCGYHLSKLEMKRGIIGRMLRYSTSLTHPPIPVEDLGMGVTAPATIRHWVGYTAIGYQ